MKRIWLLFVCIVCAASLAAQSNSSIKELEERRQSLQKQIQESEKLLNTTKKDVGSQLNSLATLTGQIEERKRYILVITNDLAAVNREIASLEKQLKQLEADLKEKRKRYESSVQYLRKNKTIEEKLLFILSAETLAQTYRRMRYVNEYATYQRLQGEEILAKQEQVKKKKKELGRTKAAKESLLKEREKERTRLVEQEKQQKNIVAGLRKKQKGLQDELAKKRRESKRLNDRIEKLIAEEIERARKLAEAEAKKENAAKGKSTGTTKGAAPMAGFTMSKADRELSGSFVNNRGKLPMPVTGPYTIVSRYGQYTVEGLRNVKLDNKGIDIQTQPGAEARAIFNGEVSAVFQFQANGLYNILVRHGNYISVYCNLSNPSVKKGDKVKTGQSLGKIFSDKRDNNRTVLHFQLRKEKQQMNPEPWLNR